MQAESGNACCFVQNSGLIFYYSGYFSQNIINAIGDAVRLRLELSGAPTGVRRKLFSTFIEMTQNIIHYSADSLTPLDRSNDEMRAGSVCLSCEDGDFSVVCVNPVTLGYANLLHGKLTTLKAMSIEQIREEYRRQLRTDSPEDSKGAGLGLLTIARDSRLPLEFEFEPLNAECALFRLKATF
jgi:hypothetical protein